MKRRSKTTSGSENVLRKQLRREAVRARSDITCFYGWIESQESFPWMGSAIRIRCGFAPVGKTQYFVEIWGPDARAAPETAKKRKGRKR